MARRSVSVRPTAVGSGLPLSDTEAPPVDAPTRRPRILLMVSRIVPPKGPRRSADDPMYAHGRAATSTYQVARIPPTCFDETIARLGEGARSSIKLLLL